MNQWLGPSPSFQPQLVAGRLSFADRLWPALAFVLLATSSIVQREPAPYDFLLLAGMLLFIISGPRIPSALAWPALSILLLILGYVIGAMFASFKADAYSYIGTSTYVSVSCLFFAALVWRSPERIVPPLARGAVIASIIAATLGILGYFNAIPNAEAFALYGRATGPFKDPNVFGPSLVFPSLYLVHRLASRPAREMVWRLPPLMLLIGAIFLSFSRGAWINFIFAGLVFLVLTAAMAPAQERRRFFRFSLLVLAFLVIGIAWAISIEEVRTVFMQRFTLAQDYDAAEGGRFDNMYAAFMTALTHPLGIGPNQWPHISASTLMPHNIYVNVFVSGGLLSFVGFTSLTLMTLWVGLASLKRYPPMIGVMAAAIGAFSGHALEGFIIDSNHWRHIYVLIGLIWGLALAANGVPRYVPVHPRS